MILRCFALALVAAAALALPEPEESCESRLAVAESAFAEGSRRQLAQIRRLKAEVHRLRRGPRRRGERQHHSEALLQPPRPLANTSAAPAPASRELDLPEEPAAVRRLKPSLSQLCVSAANDFSFNVRSEAELEAFVKYVNNQRCSEIGSVGRYGLLKFSGDVKSLAPLKRTSLRSIWGELTIKYTQLEDLDGLGWLTEVNILRLESNPLLKSLAGLRAAVSQHLEVTWNPILTSLAGPTVRNRVREVYLFSNAALKSLDIFDDVEEVLQSVSLIKCLALDDLTGLRRLRVVGASVTVEALPVLSLEGLENLEVVWGLVLIKDNWLLQSFRGLHKLRLTGKFESSGNVQLQVLGGLFSDAPSYSTIGTLEATELPKCTTPQEWDSIAAGFLMSPATLAAGAAPPTRESWLTRGCGPDQQTCWVGLPCILDLGASGFQGRVSLPATGKTCGPCLAETALIGSHGKVDITSLLGSKQPGLFSLCKCAPGPTGAAALAQFSYLGPRHDHDLVCSRGSKCIFPLQGLFDPNATVTLARACGTQDVVLTATMGSQGVFSVPGGSAALVGTSPGSLRLCWRPPCDQIPSQSACVDKDIGQLVVLGPYTRDSSSVVLGGALSVPNLGLGVNQNDSMRLLPSCGSAISGGLVDTSGVRFLFDFSLDAQSAGVGNYRMCWCNGASAPCNDPSHFLVDTGGVDIVCPADKEPEPSGRCRPCPAGSYKDKPGNVECATSPSYVAFSAVFSTLVFLACFAMLVTFRSPIRVEDVSTMTGRTLVSTLRMHGLHMYGLQSFVVTFRFTSHPGLDRPSEVFRARRTSPTCLELLAADEGSIDARLDTSRGIVKLPPMEELVHRGWPLPLIASVPLLAIAAFAVHMLQQQSTDHAIIGGGVALVVALALRVASRSFRPQSQLDRRIEDYRKVLLAKNPKPTEVDKGPKRAIQIGELINLLEFFQSFIKDRTAYYMDTNIFGPLTKPERLSYAELVGPQKVQWFVSHYWGNSFVHFCEAVQKHAEWAAHDGWRQVAYWICFCSNNQYMIEEELGVDWSESSFFLALRSGLCYGVCMVLDEQAMPLTRSWCIFEVLQALHLERKSDRFQGLMLCTNGGVLNVGQGSVEVAMNLARRIATLDLETAGASCESDKVMINTQVITELGSFHAMNQMVRHKMHDILVTARSLANESFDELFKLLDGHGETFNVGHSFEECWREADELEKQHTVDLCSIGTHLQHSPLEHKVHELI